MKLCKNKNSSFTKNIFYLYLLQIAQYVLPLLTLPHILITLGPEYFGILAFATVTVTYFQLIIDYGFNLSATQKIATNKNSQAFVNDIFNSVMFIKLALVIFCGFILFILVLSFEKLNEHFLVYVFSFLAVSFNSLFPIWLFQGMEEMKTSSLFNIANKTVFTICTLSLVSKPDHYVFVPFFTMLGALLSAGWSILYVKKKFLIQFSIPSKKFIQEQIYDGWEIFTSKIAISLYTTSVTFILGIFTNNTMVGYYAAADKIVHAIKGLYVPISQAAFPVSSRLLKENRPEGLLFLKIIGIRVCILMLILSCLLFFFSNHLLVIIVGEEYLTSNKLIKIMSFTPVLVTLSNIFGIQIMINLGYKREFQFFVFISAIFGLVSSTILVLSFSAIGAAISVLLTESLITTLCILFTVNKLKKVKI